jgi:hypothetical protein
MDIRLWILTKVAWVLGFTAHAYRRRRESGSVAAAAYATNTKDLLEALTDHEVDLVMMGEEFEREQN